MGKKLATNRAGNENEDWERGLGCTKEAVRSLAQGLFTRDCFLWQPKQSSTNWVA